MSTWCESNLWKEIIYGKKKEANYRIRWRHDILQQHPKQMDGANKYRPWWWRQNETKNCIWQNCRRGQIKATTGKIWYLHRRFCSSLKHNLWTTWKTSFGRQAGDERNSRANISQAYGNAETISLNQQTAAAENKLLNAQTPTAITGGRIRWLNDKENLYDAEPMLQRSS